MQIEKGPYIARFAQSSDDLCAVQRLRYRAFHGGEGLDADRFDPICRHVMVEECQSGQLLACFRMFLVPKMGPVLESYSADFYDLACMSELAGGKLEVGRFCIAPEVSDPSVLRLAWSVITRVVRQEKIDLLFGCSSFKGTDERPYEDAFALLKERHLGPVELRPKPKSQSIFRFAKKLRLRKANLKQANKSLPPLLRSYLTMGGWVSDHAVIDSEMNTLHVFTGLQIKLIPPARKRLLFADAV